VFKPLVLLRGFLVFLIMLMRTTHPKYQSGLFLCLTLPLWGIWRSILQPPSSYHPALCETLALTWLSSPHIHGARTLQGMETLILTTFLTLFGEVGPGQCCSWTFNPSRGGFLPSLPYFLLCSPCPFSGPASIFLKVSPASKLSSFPFWFISPVSVRWFRI
jgi:hypothetical protein